MDDRCEKFLLVMAICIAVYGVLEFVISCLEEVERLHSFQ